MEHKKIITFLDAAQRTIIGEEVYKDEIVIKIKNPVVVNIVPKIVNGSQEGVSLQLIPVFFHEFLADKNTSTVFSYKLSQVTEINFDCGFDIRLQSKYNSIFKSTETVTKNKQPEVLKLFEDSNEK